MAYNNKWTDEMSNSSDEESNEFEKKFNELKNIKSNIDYNFTNNKNLNCLKNIQKDTIEKINNFNESNNEILLELNEFIKNKEIKINQLIKKKRNLLEKLNKHKEEITNKISNNKKIQNTIENKMNEIIKNKKINIIRWTIDDVIYWLQNNGYGEYSDEFEEDEIDGEMLMKELTKEDLRGMGIKPLKKRNKFWEKIKNLRNKYNSY